MGDWLRALLFVPGMIVGMLVLAAIVSVSTVLDKRRRRERALLKWQAASVIRAVKSHRPTPSSDDIGTAVAHFRAALEQRGHKGEETWDARPVSGDCWQVMCALGDCGRDEDGNLCGEWPFAWDVQLAVESVTSHDPNHEERLYSFFRIPREAEEASE